MAGNITIVLPSALEIEGAKGVALGDYNSGMVLGLESRNSSFNMEIAVAVNAEVIRAKLSAIRQLNLKDQIEDILISLQNEYHLIRLLDKYEGLFLYLVLDRTKSNLALARYKLNELEKTLQL